MENTYLKYLGLENFRNFEKQVLFNFAPITLLAGPNSSGKSSVIKAIQLFQSGIHQRDGIQDLYVYGGDHHLGLFHNMINQESFENEVKFTFEFPIPSLFEYFLLELSYIPNPKTEEFGVLNRIRIFNDEADLVFIEKSEDPKKGFGQGKVNFPYILDRINEIKGKLSENRNPNKVPFYHLEGAFGTTHHFYQEESNENLNLFFKTGFDASKFLKKVQSTELIREFKNLSFSEREQIRKIPEKHWEEGAFIEDFSYPFSKPELISAIDICLYGFLKELGLAENEYSGIHFSTRNFLTKLSNKYHPTTLTEYIHENIIKDEVIRELDLSIERLKKIDIIKSARQSQSRFYGDKFDESELHTLANHFLNEERLISSTESSFVNRSIHFFGIGNQLIIERNQGTTTEIYIESERGKFLLADLGSGITQLVTLILKIDKIGKEKGLVIREASEHHRPSVLIIEHPEINLSPEMQTRLATFILHTAESFNIQFILETHSIPLIQSFQKLVVDKKVVPHYLKLFFFNNINSIFYNNQPVNEVQFLKSGELSNSLGEGFNL